jgi:hypothetical protein
MGRYSMMEDEFLCDLWLVISADFVAMRQGGLTFWQSVHSSFHEQNDIMLYGFK